MANTPASRPVSLPPCKRCDDCDNAPVQADGRLQLVDAEHRQRQRNEHEREYAEHPRRLQPRREALAGEAGGDTERGVDQRHAERVARGEREPAAATGGGGAVADDDRRQDRQHRQHARRKRQQYAGDEEHADDDPEAAGAQRGVDARGVGRRRGVDRGDRPRGCAGRRAVGGRRRQIAGRDDARAAVAAEALQAAPRCCSPSADSTDRGRRSPGS